MLHVGWVGRWGIRVGGILKLISRSVDWISCLCLAALLHVNGTFLNHVRFVTQKHHQQKRHEQWEMRKGTLIFSKNKGKKSGKKILSLVMLIKFGLVNIQKKWLRESFINIYKFLRCLIACLVFTDIVFITKIKNRTTLIVAIVKKTEVQIFYRSTIIRFSGNL